MGDLINLPLRRLRAEAAAQPQSQSATILLFTGIRYERIAEADPARETPGPKKPRGRRRA